jgi:hypothetical protein
MVGMKKYNSVRSNVIIDGLYLILGISIVIMSVVCFMDPEEYELLFTIIFLLASVLNIGNGVCKIKNDDNKRTVKLSGALEFIFGIVLFILAIISVVYFLGR